MGNPCAYAREIHAPQALEEKSARWEDLIEMVCFRAYNNFPKLTLAGFQSREAKNRHCLVIILQCEDY